MNQLQIGKDMRVGQGVKKSSLWKILTLGQHAGRENFTQPQSALQSCFGESTPRGGELMNKLALKLALAFFCLYGLFNFTGIIFFSGWSKPTTLDSIVKAFYKFPVDWVHLIVEISGWFLLLNILFWSVVFYLLVFLIIKISLRFR